jgi:hypothetical protein
LFEFFRQRNIYLAETLYLYNEREGTLMKFKIHIVGAAVALALVACGTQQPRTEAERQQEIAESRADSAREVADTHEAANEDVREAQEALREAEDDAQARSVDAQESRVRETEARARAASAPATARDKIETAEAQSRHRSARETCDTLSDESRDNCIAAADAQLEEDLARLQ